MATNVRELVLCSNNDNKHVLRKSQKVLKHTILKDNLMASKVCSVWS